MRGIDLNKQLYVLIGIFSRDLQEVLLVLKDKPDWQKGKLNLVGGKVEDGESIRSAACRELYEETGLSCDIGWSGTIEGIDFIVNCYSGISDEKEINQRPEETETVYWYSLPDVLDNPNLIGNLKTIIPLMLNNEIGWSIKE